MQYLRADTITEVTVGPAVAVGDGFTPVTSLTIAGADEAELIKHGATTTTAIAGTLAAITGADGYYALDLSATDTNTEGRLTLLINDDSLILPIRHEFMVVNTNVYDSLFAASGTDTLDVQVTGIGANVITATSINADAITSAKIAADAIGSSEFAQAAADKVWSSATRVLTANTNLNDPTAAAVAAAVWDEDATGHQTTGTFGQAIGDPVANTKTLYAALVTDAVGASVTADVATAQADLDIITGADGVNLLSATQTSINAIETDTNSLNDTKIPDTISLANINTQCDTALSDIGLQYLVNTALPTNWATDITANSALDWIAEDGTAGYDRTTDSLQAVRDHAATIKSETALIVADTNELQTDWADAGRLDAILDARASQATADAIETDTQDIQARLPAALIGGRMDSDIEAINNSTTAAIQLALSAAQIESGACEGTPSTTVIQTDLAETQDDIYIGRTVIFTSGNARGEATDITDYTGSTGTLTVTALANAPAASDTFILI